MRKNQGDYDSFFRIAKRQHGGTLDERVSRMQADLAEGEHLLRVLRRALIRAGLTTPAALESRRAEVAQPGPWNGARIVARAWVDPEFKRSLLEHGRAAVRELDIPPGRLGPARLARPTPG